MVFSASQGHEVHRHHVVQFYESDAYLAEAVGRFLRPALATGHAAVVIATPEHRAAFAGWLSDAGVDVDAAVTSRQLRLVDARETLSAILVDGAPRWESFERVIEGILADCRRAHAGPVHAYGEMVDLLWRDG
ncbi:MAG TPA: MEDS domain-containing protein, partial [Minicystis sp.]|nr:MEDS domain-containing protein [Minicystis sp.]